MFTTNLKQSLFTYCMFFKEKIIKIPHQGKIVLEVLSILDSWLFHRASKSILLAVWSQAQKVIFGGLRWEERWCVFSGVRQRPQTQLAIGVIGEVGRGGRHGWSGPYAAHGGGGSEPKSSPCWWTRSSTWCGRCLAPHAAGQLSLLWQTLTPQSFMTELNRKSEKKPSYMIRKITPFFKGPYSTPL